MNIGDIYLENMVLKAAKGAEPAEAQQVHTDASKAVRNAAFQYGAAQKTLEIN